MVKTRGAAIMTVLVRIIFIGCYVAFMWASIHHIATFYNDFEAGGGNIVGSYAIAGAIDITALVTTTAIMFFRKSMPIWVFLIVWVFVLALAGYSTFINWEYATHFQNMELIMQPTGAMQPVYDRSNVLHYVAQMKVNLSLLKINPIFASGFTLFSLVYSIIAEFFGSKPPTAAELDQQIKYFEETAVKQKRLKELRDDAKGPGFIATLRDKTNEAVDAGKDVFGNAVGGKTKQEEASQEETEQPAEEEPSEESPIEEDEEPREESKLDQTLKFMDGNMLVTDQMIADHLQVDIISARRWKEKALILLEPNRVEESEKDTDEVKVTSFQFERDKRGAKRGPKPGSKRKSGELKSGELKKEEEAANSL